MSMNKKYYFLYLLKIFRFRGYVKDHFFVYPKRRRQDDIKKKTLPRTRIHSCIVGTFRNIVKLHDSQTDKHFFADAQRSIRSLSHCANRAITISNTNIPSKS